MSPSRYKRMTLILAAALPLVSAGPGVDQEDIQRFDKYRGEVQDFGKIQPNCDLVLASQEGTVSCTELSDSMCAKLYPNGKENRELTGNLDFNGAKFRQGKFANSELTEIEYQNINDMAESVERLPEDLRAKTLEIAKGTKDSLKKLESLRKDQDEVPAYRDLSDRLTDFDRAMQDVALARTKKRMPDLPLRYEDRTPEQKIAVAEDRADLDNQALEAKYKDHPNWKRVERLFSQVKSDLLAEITKLNLPKETRAKMLAKLDTVELSLPYTDTRLLGAGTTCGTTEINAFYSPSYNKFTVCAGYFNGYQSDAVIYGTMAHELSHSIDPATLREDEFEQTDIATAFKRFSAGKSKPIDCSEWNALSKKLADLPQVLPPMSFPEIEKLSNCFESREKLKELNLPWIIEQADQQAATDMSSYATYGTFENLANDTNNKDREPNSYFLRPDLDRASNNGFIRDNLRAGTIPAREIFVQSLLCLPDFQKSNLVQQKKWVAQALQQTRDLTKAYYVKYNSILQRESYHLISFGLAKNTREYFADWMAFHAIPKFLEREKTVKGRRSLMAEWGAKFCDPDAPKFAEEQKAHSQEEHPLNRNRRLSAFTEKIAEILDCNRSPESTGGFTQCELK